MTNTTIVCPYIFENEIRELKDKTWNLPIVFEEDIGRIGSDMMYQRLWNKYKHDHIFIMHADMLPIEDDTDNNWFSDICDYLNKYEEAGILGCKLLYPAKDEKSNKYIIQSAGGRFINDIPDHFGSGLDILNNKQFKSELEIDNGQYDYIREVAWITFGGILLRREMLNQIGNFDACQEGTYNRDVDYCLRVREAGWKIYQTPVPLIHYESKDNKRLMAQNPEMHQHWSRNLKYLKDKWLNTEYYKTLDIRVE